MSEQPNDDKHWEQYRMPKGTNMKKTKPLIRILLGISLIMLITGLNQYFTDVMATKHIITTCIAVIILFFLFLTKMIRRDTLIPSLKDSLPYFTACFLIGSGGLVQVEWMVLVLAAIIFIADFAGDG